VATGLVRIFADWRAQHTTSMCDVSQKIAT